MKQELRRARGNLTLCGVGIVLFGTWGFGKTVLYNLFAASYVHALLERADIAPELERGILVLWLIAAFLGALLDIYVGTRAMREGRGERKRRKAYLVIAALLLVGNVSAVVQNILLFSGLTTGYLDLVGQSLVELVQAVNLALLMFYAGQVRKLSRQTEQEGSHAD